MTTEEFIDQLTQILLRVDEDDPYVIYEKAKAYDSLLDLRARYSTDNFQPRISEVLDR